MFNLSNLKIMMKSIKKLLVLLFFASILLVSCEKDEDNTAPGVLVNVEATGQDHSVLIRWSQPADSDLDKIIITYTSDIEYNIEVIAGTEEKTIEELTNDQEYTFKLKAVDKSGNESVEIQVTATPELTVFKVSGFEIENGTYSVTDDNDFTTTRVFSGTNTLNSSLQAGSNTFSWSGTWERDGVSVITELENTTTQDIYKDTISAAFCFEVESDKYYYHGAYEKISGETGELIGEYSNSNSSENSTVVKSVKILSDGTYELFIDGMFDEYGSWTDDDIRNKKFVFIDFMDNSYLYFPDSYVLKKQ